MVGQALKNRWLERGGYRDLISMAFPLILSTGASSILHFIDRMFLTWYSPNSVAAAMPAGMVNFMFMAIFIGTASYVSTFVAQYFGAKKPKMIGPSLWQSLYIALFGGVVIFTLSFFAKPIFAFVGHDSELQVEEALYFSILSKGAVFGIAASSFAGFFSGRGKNWPVLWANITMLVVNVGLDYLFIFGRAGFPEMGIRGAAIATVIAGGVSCAYYIALVFRKGHERAFKTVSGWKPNGELIRRMIRYGLPSGIQFFIDMFGFSVFILLIGRIGTDELAATSITFNINTLAFMPMIGFGVAISVTVGQFIGEDKPGLAERSVFSGAHMCFLYMTLMAITYVAFPQIYISAFAANAAPGQFDTIRGLIIMLLQFVAVFTLVDTVNIVFSSALKGAGDTKFVMIMIICLSILGLTIPTYIALVVFEAGLRIGFFIISTYIFVLAVAFLLRFFSGKWKNMKVIESPTHTAVLNLPEVPTPEIEV